MKVGVQINRFDFPGATPKIGENLKNIAIAAENSGIDSLWVMDHFFQISHVGPYTDPMLEAYTSLGYLAGVTNHVKLGTMVTGVIYREPAVLIKAVTTLDVLSSGRAYFGIGAGWNDQEAIALGLTDPLNSKRFSRLEETLKLAKQMWSGDESPFNGEIYKLPEPMLNPGSVSLPHPPILIGGGGEEKTLRLVAKYGDACNLFASDIEMLEHKLSVLRRHCEEIGRNYDEIEKTALAGINISAAAKDQDMLLKKAEQLNNVGISHMILAVSNSANVQEYEKLSSCIGSIHKI